MSNFNSQLFIGRLLGLLENDKRKKGDFYKYIGSAGIVQNWKQRGSAPQADKLLAIAQYFNVTIDYLVGLSDEPGPNIARPLYQSSSDTDVLFVKSPPAGNYHPMNANIDLMMNQVNRICNNRGQRDIDKLKLFLYALDPGGDDID